MGKCFAKTIVEQAHENVGKALYWRRKPEREIEKEQMFETDNVLIKCTGRWVWDKPVDCD